MVRHNIEMSLSKVVRICPHGCKYSEELAIVRRVALLRVRKFFAPIGDNFLAIVVLLGEDEINTAV